MYRGQSCDVPATSGQEVEHMMVGKQINITVDKDL